MHFSRVPMNHLGYRYKVYRNPSNQKSLFDEYVFKNTVVFNPNQRARIKHKHIKIKSEVWKTEFNSSIPDGYIYLNGIQRVFYSLAYGDTVDIMPFLAIGNPFDEHLSRISIDLFSKGKKMDLKLVIQSEQAFKAEITHTLQGNLLSGRQPFCMKFATYSFKILIRSDFETTGVIGTQTHYEIKPDANISIHSYNGEDMSMLMNFGERGERGENGEEIGYYQTPLQSWNLKKEGVGGLGDVANELFRRAFASRQNPVYAKRLGTKHVKGVLLYGPPGCGKTTLARVIAQSLNKNIPPKIISGPEIFDKFVGESQRKVRELFVDAENDEAKYGERSPLHVFIFDEFDSIGRKRSSNDSTGSNVGNQVVNQLLAKIDGHDALNNILILALTNRKDMIDTALLRPGRLEIQIEIKLPTECDRKEIFEIHTSTMMENEALDESVSMSGLAKRANNFTGAEIEGLVKSAASYALARTINIDEETNQIIVSTSPNENTDNVVEEPIMVRAEDFNNAFEDIKPQFGIQQHQMFLGSEDISIPESLMSLNVQDDSIQTVLIYTNTTQKRSHEQIVGKLAVESGVGCLMCVDYFDMIGMNELQICKYMKEVYLEASKTLESIVVINHLDTILGIRYNTSVLQTVVTLLRYYPCVTTIATVSGTRHAIESTELDKHFDVTKKIE